MRTNRAGAADGVILQEYRQLKEIYFKLTKEKASCHYLLQLYLQGPARIYRAIRDSSSTLDGIVTDIPSIMKNLRIIWGNTSQRTRIS